MDCPQTMTTIILEWLDGYPRFWLEKREDGFYALKGKSTDGTGFVEVVFPAAALGSLYRVGSDALSLLRERFGASVEVKE